MRRMFGFLIGLFVGWIFGLAAFGLDVFFSQVGYYAGIIYPQRFAEYAWLQRPVALGRGFAAPRAEIRVEDFIKRSREEQILFRPAGRGHPDYRQYRQCKNENQKRRQACSHKSPCLIEASSMETPSCPLY